MHWYKFKRLKIIVVAVILCMSALALFSCTAIETVQRAITNRFTSEESLDLAVEITQNFLDALVDKNYSLAYELISSQDRQEYSLEEFEKEFNDVTDITYFEINWVEVKNNIAVVCIDFMDSYDGEEKLYKDQEISLVKEEEQWKINFAQ
ncbi:MAG: hypothetical protein PHN32_03380 [Actinomycetota bacterium]|jgi:hypothetical protein|nr:hypothetical protein [Actinomycetota bacterium]